MEGIDYLEIARGFKKKKSLGQNFLVNTEIAAIEANYGKGMNVLELGSGLGILTMELLDKAKRVISIEKDSSLFERLKSEFSSKKLVLLEGDFFDMDIKQFKPIDIMISNIPYNLSSKTLYWLAENNIPAVLCIQKEFADHLFALPGSKSYSKLSVVSSLSFKSYRIREVAAGNFYPRPKVDSSIVYLAPIKNTLDAELIVIISSLMNHKKKKLRNAIIDSSKSLGISKDQAKQIAGSKMVSRPFQMKPEELLFVAENLRKSLPIHWKE